MQTGLESTGAEQDMTCRKQRLYRICLAACGVVGALCVAGFLAHRNMVATVNRNSCIGYCQILNSLKTQYAMANGLEEGDEVTIDTLEVWAGKPYCRVCRGGGRYLLGVVGLYPECEMPEHNEPAIVEENIQKIRSLSKSLYGKDGVRIGAVNRRAVPEEDCDMLNTLRERYGQKVKALLTIDSRYTNCAAMWCSHCGGLLVYGNVASPADSATLSNLVQTADCPFRVSYRVDVVAAQ